MNKEIILLTTSLNNNEDFILDAYALNMDEAIEIAKNYCLDVYFNYKRDEFTSTVEQLENKEIIITIKDINGDLSIDFRLVRIPHFSPEK